MKKFFEEPEVTVMMVVTENITADDDTPIISGDFSD